MDSQERFENMVGLVEAHQYEWAIWQAARRTASADASAKPVGYGKKSQLDAIGQNGSALLYSVACSEEDWDVPLYAAPTPERAQEPDKWAFVEFVAAQGGRAQESAGVLTDEQIREIWLRETGFDEQATPFAILDFARAILAAKKEPQS